MIAQRTLIFLTLIACALSACTTTRAYHGRAVSSSREIRIALQVPDELTVESAYVDNYDLGDFGAEAAVLAGTRFVRFDWTVEQDNRETFGRCSVSFDVAEQHRYDIIAAPTPDGSVGLKVVETSEDDDIEAVVAEAECAS